MFVRVSSPWVLLQEALYIQVWYSVFYMLRYKQSNRYFYLLDNLYWSMSNVLYHNSTYNRLPEDKPTGSKHTEDIKN